MVLISIFFLALSGMSEIGKKILNTNDKLKKMPILAIFGHFWPVFGPFQIWYGRQILGNSVSTSAPARVK